MTAQKATIAVVGYGPTGMTAAALLGQAGHRVVVIERWPGLYGLPRFTHIDDETARTLQEVCDIDRALEDSTPTRYEWVNGQDELLLEIPTAMGDKGYWQHNSIYQPAIEDAIDARIRSLTNVEIKQGWVVLGYTQDEQGVRLEIAPWVGQEADRDAVQTLEVDYVIGADGARSAIREATGTDRNDFGFLETWINVDTEWLRPHDEKFAIAKQYCDPARGHMYMGIGKNRQRFEFAVLPDEDSAQYETTEAAWTWLDQQHGLGPEDVKIVRQLKYTFAGRVATQWRHGRVFLAGDAAHVMPPYLGQGACSGIRDAANLAWKLDLVLTAQASDSILDTYQEEREPHATAAVLMSIELGKVANTTDPEQAAARDAAFKAGQVPPPPGLPQLAGSLLPEAGENSPVGAMSPQGTLRTDAGDRRGDDLIGGGFRIVGTPEAVDALGEAQQSVLDRLGVTVLALGRDAEDVDGVYGGFLEAHGGQAAIVRPDHVVHAVATAEELPVLVEDLGSRILAPATVRAGA